MKLFAKPSKSVALGRIIAWVGTAWVLFFVGFVLFREWAQTHWSDRIGILIAGIVGVNLVWHLAKDSAKREAQRCPHCGRLP